MSRGKVCFLSMDDLGGYVSDDELAVGPLNDLGWEVETVSWRAEADWSRYDAAIVRTTWDYQDDPETFLTVLTAIENAGTRLFNPVPTIAGNIDKVYLRELGKRGIRIVPTIWGEGKLDSESIEEAKAEFETKELIVKPTISATAQNTFRINGYSEDAATALGGRRFMIQPFVPSIVDEGEYSIFYFAGEYSHAIRKTPKSNDFRVQEEHGGIIRSVEADQDLIEAAESIQKLIAPVPLYSRIDLVRMDSGFALMELELIEPALYFRTDAGSPARFAAAFDRMMNLSAASHT